MELIEKYINELEKSGMSFTDFKVHTIKNNLGEYRDLFSLQTMSSYRGKSFTSFQLLPHVYNIIKQRINYKPDRNWICN